MAPMSRLRRMVLCDRFFLITCRLLPKRRILSESEFARLARVIGERRKEHGFLLTAWVFLPDHWHAILFPRHPLTICEVMEAIKVASTKGINPARGESGLLWQGRFPSAALRASFDRALRTVKEYNEKVAYIRGNPVKAGLIKRQEQGRRVSEERNSALPAPRGPSQHQGAHRHGHRGQIGASDHRHAGQANAI